jgi:hypothetical protein
LDADGDRISFQLCKELEDAEEQRDAEQETNIKVEPACSSNASFWGPQGRYSM